MKGADQLASAQFVMACQCEMDLSVGSSRKWLSINTSSSSAVPEVGARGREEE